MATMKSWGIPTDPINVPVIGDIYFGEHTWVTTDERTCWNILGGGYPFYCGPQRWNGNTYVPPTITWKGKDVTGRELSSAPGESAKAQCMGGSEGWFAGIPTYAGIIYGVHGVCHQMADRVMLTAGTLVSKAEGFPESSFTYGIYGTTIPRFVWNAVFWFPAVAAALAAYTAGMNIAFAIECGRCGVRYPGPILAAGDDERRLVAEVMRLHGATGDAPVAPRAAEVALAAEENQQRGLREVELLLGFLSRGRVSETKIARVREAYAAYLGPAPDAVKLVAEAMRSDPLMIEAASEAEIDQFALEANRSALAQRDEVANILGAADFETIFGVHPDVRVGLVDPRILRHQPNVAGESAG